MPFAIPIDLAFCWSDLLIRAQPDEVRPLHVRDRRQQEAARRAGIQRRPLPPLAFVFAGFTAGVGGLFFVSRLGGYSSMPDGHDAVLYAVAAAVIGGTSLYGGRGKMINPVIGGIMWP